MLCVDDLAIWLSYFNGKKKKKAKQYYKQHLTVLFHGHRPLSLPFRDEKLAITFTRKYRTVEPSLLLYGHPIRYVNYTKFLGLHFDEKMTWKYHIESVREKCG